MILNNKRCPSTHPRPIGQRVVVIVGLLAGLAGLGIGALGMIDSLGSGSMQSFLVPAAIATTILFVVVALLIVAIQLRANT